MKLISKWYFILLYIELTIVKFFTAKVSYRIEEAPLIVLKKVPNIYNTVRSGEDLWLAQNWDRDAWYGKGEFLRLFSTYGNDVILGAYDAVVFLWALCTILILIYMIYLGAVKIFGIDENKFIGALIGSRIVKNVCIALTAAIGGLLILGTVLGIVGRL